MKPALLISPELQAQGLEEARACGRLGLPRPSDSALFAGGVDPSDTYIGRCWDEFDAGRRERGKTP